MIGPSQGGAAMRRRSAGAVLAVEPDDGRRDHRADRDRHRLPGLQRELRPALRPDLQHLGAAPGRRQARDAATRCGSAASGSARSPRSRRRRTLRPASSTPQLELGSGPRRRGVARRLDRDRQGPLRAGAQVPRDRPGRLERGLRRRARSSRPRPLASPATSTTSSTPSTSRRGSRSRPTWSSSATPWPVAAPT